MSNSPVLAGPSIGTLAAGITASNAPALDRAGVTSFSSQALEQFDRYLETSKNRTIFDAIRRAKYRNWLLNPDADVTTHRLSKRQVAAARSEKYRALRDYCLVNGQLHRKPEKRFDLRVVACTYDAADHIIRIHEELVHAGNRKTHQRLQEQVYGITEDDVVALLPSCNVCVVNRPSNTRAPLEPIQALRVLERVQVDLIDYRHFPDGRFKWIMHIKDHVSKYTALFAQTSKEASECATSLGLFIKFLGEPEICQSDNGREFKGILLILLKRHGIRAVYGRPRTPRTQGLVEQGNSVVKDKLRKWMYQHGSDRWSIGLDDVMIAMNKQAHESLPLGVSPSQVMFNRKVRKFNSRTA